MENAPAPGQQLKLFEAVYPSPRHKSDIASLEHPFFALSKRPVREIRRYQHGDVAIEIVPSAKGIPTLYDRDVLLYATAQLVEAINRGQETSASLRIRVYDLLKSTNRGTSGRAYLDLQDALDRLRGATIKTSICTGGRKTTCGFGLVESYTLIQREHVHEGSLLLVISDWMYRAVINREVLTLDAAYFKLRQPLQRRLYEIFRKHVGHQSRWSISLSSLHNKTGSSAPLRRFRFELARMVSSALPEPLNRYSLHLDSDFLRVYPRNQAGLAAMKADLTLRLGKMGAKGPSDGLFL